jgi:hypothetical protein
MNEKTIIKELCSLATLISADMEEIKEMLKEILKRLEKESDQCTNGNQ